MFWRSYQVNPSSRERLSGKYMEILYSMMEIIGRTYGEKNNDVMEGRPALRTFGTEFMVYKADFIVDQPAQKVYQERHR